jgi:hypothetical protein
MDAWLEVVGLSLAWLAAVVGLVALWGHLRRRQQRAEVDRLVVQVLTEAQRAARREGRR